jgi:uncharacterized membrane protein
MLNWFRNSARSFFTPAEDRQIIEAIREAELHTSGEIRLHLEPRCKAPETLWRAAQLFRQLKMHETAERNGVLIYFATAEKRFAIYADQGIHDAVPPGFWQDIVNQMHDHFIHQRFLEGLTQGIRQIGRSLQQYFPRQEGDINELPDEISYS